MIQTRSFLDHVRDAAAGRRDPITTRRDAVGGGTSGSGSWAEDLAAAPGAAEMRARLARELALPQVAAWRVAWDEWTTIQAGRPAGYIVGPNDPRPLSPLSVARVRVTPRAAGSMVAVSRTLLDHPSAANDAALSRLLVSAARSAANAALLDPSAPGSITAGVTPVPSSGLSDAAIFEDVAQLLGVADAPVIIASLPWAVRFRAALGASGDLVRLVVAPEAGDTVVAVDPDALAGQWGDLAVDTSDAATLEMDDAPTQDVEAGTGSTLVSMWQTNSVAFRAEIEVGWQLARQDAVRVLEMATES